MVLSIRTRFGFSWYTLMICRFNVVSKRCHFRSSRRRIQQNNQPVVAPCPFAHSLPAASLQDLQPRGHPGLHLIELVVAFRQHMHQPDRRGPSQARPHPVAVRLKGGISNSGIPVWRSAPPRQEYHPLVLWSRYDLLP